MPTTYLQHRVSISNYAHFSKSKIPTKISSKLKPSNKFSEFSIKSVRNVILLIFLFAYHNNRISNISYDCNDTFSSQISINRINQGKYREGITEYGYQRVIQLNNNKSIHILNGNRSTNKGLNILQVNKGNSFFENKIESIQRLINLEKPDILCISESNARKSRVDNYNHFQGYNHELNLMSNDIDISRNSIMINKNLNYKRRLDLESPDTCNIWLEIYLSKGHNLLLMGGYRTWSSLKVQNIPNSNSNKNQLKRFQITLDNWGKAMYEDKDVIVCTDDNIDSSEFNRHNKNTT